MPFELVKAHTNLNRAVILAYGFKGINTEAEIVENLMDRYENLTKEINISKRKICIQ